eukprot:TRINITY_DN9245_c0_g1_i1.p1 TRINITY_DN9245_c0_g1~~TRINITY_DN9245_c0_g1_i1.p1  ORF type:complete len:623 (-),score=199.20 TRINITY_DN9245_c0_g1_i1:79-1770(-)
MAELNRPTSPPIGGASAAAPAELTAAAKRDSKQSLDDELAAAEARRKRLQELQRELRNQVLGIGDAVPAEERKPHEYKPREPVPDYKPRFPVALAAAAAAGVPMHEESFTRMEAKLRRSEQETTVKKLTAQVAKLETSKQGSEALEAQEQARVRELQATIAGLKAQLHEFEIDKPEPVSLTYVPPELLPPPPVPTLPEHFAPGDTVLAKFSDTEYFLCTVVEEADRNYIVRVGTDDTTVAKSKVFPPFADITASIARCEATTAALRARWPTVENGYEALLAGVRAEMDAVRADTEALRRRYGEDFCARADAAADELLRAYPREAGVASFLTQNVKEVQEYSRGDTRWFTADDNELWEDIADADAKPRSGLHTQLFHLHSYDAADPELTEIFNFGRRPLHSDEVFVIDTGNDVDIYFGSSTMLDAKIKSTMAVGALKKLRQDPRLQSAASASSSEPAAPPGAEARAEVVLNETLNFRLHFCGFQRKPRPSLSRNRRDTYSYRELETGAPYVPRTASPERFLADDEFAQIFSMRRSRFATLPAWHRSFLRLKHRINHLVPATDTN